MQKLKKTIISFRNRYNNLNVVAKASIWFVFCTMIQKCVSVITVPIFTRIMDPEQYGVFSTYSSWESIFAVFCTLEMHKVIYINNYTKAECQEDKDFSAIPLLSLSSVITLVMFGIYLIFHDWFNTILGLPTILVCLLFAQIFFLPPMQFWTMQQRFEYRYKALVIRTMLMLLCNTILGVLFVLLIREHQAVARAGSIVIVTFCFGLYFFVFFWKRARCVFSTKGWKHALDVQLPLVPHNLSLIILSSSDRIMIKNMIGPVPAAKYSVAYSAGFVVNVLKNSIVNALTPWIYQCIKEKKYKEIRHMTNAIMVLVFLLTIMFTAFAPEIIWVLAPKEYADAVYVIPPVAASSYFTFLYNMFSIVGFYYEKTKRIMFVSIFGAVLNLILNFFLIPKFGYVAAAYTTLASYLFFALFHYLNMRSIAKKNNNSELRHIYDMRFIVFLSLLVIIDTIVFAFIYRWIVVRYIIIASLIIYIFIRRKYYINLFKDLKKR